MSWLFTSIAVALGGSLMLTAVYGCLFILGRQRYLFIWTVSWGLHALRYALTLWMAMSETPALLLVAEQLTTLMSGVLLLWGTQLFLARPFPAVWLIPLCVLDALWVVVAGLTQMPFFFQVTPTFFLLGAIYIWTGAAFLRLRKAQGRTTVVVGGAFILWGVHKLNYPLVRPIEWLTPWGYLLAAVLAFTIAMAIVLLYFWKVREELVESEGRFRRLADNASDVIYRCGVTPGSGCDYISPAVTAITGYTPQEYTSNPHLTAQLVQLHDEEILSAMEDASNGSGILQVVRWQHKNGGSVWIEQKLVPIKDRHGNLIAVEGIARDITERKLNEDNLSWELEVNSALADLYRPLVSPFTSIEEVANIILFHAMALTRSAYGYVSSIDPASSDNVCHTLSETMMPDCKVSPDKRRLVFQRGADGCYPLLWGHVFNTGEPFFTNSPWEHPASTGLPEGHITIQGFLSVPAMLGGEPVGQIALANKEEEYTERDLDAIRRMAPFYALAIQRVRAKEALQESEARFRSAFDHSSAGMAIVGLEGGFLEVNRAVSEMLGYTEEELLQKSWQVVTHPDDLEKSLGATHLIKNSTESVHIEKRYLHKNGSVVWVIVSSVLVRDPEGKPRYFISQFQNVTQKHLAEEAQERLETQLRQAQKMEAIGTLAGGIAHDFNNILSAIFGYTELAMHDLQEDSRAQPKLSQIMNAARRAKDLVQQILAFSRETEQQRKPVQVRFIIHETLRLLRASLPTTIEIRQNVQTRSDTVFADPTQLHQVLMNLCTNAAHAMRKTGGVLEVSLDCVDSAPEGETIHPQLKPGRYVKLSVRDTGCGMTPEIMERIFDPYFTTKEKGVGTGLGLAVVHGIAKSHGGAVTVQSEPGRGSVFGILLPLVESAPVPARITLDTMPTGEERILFVDDEKALASMGKQMLELLGYEVTIKTSSVEALEAFEANPGRFDLVITDMTMPAMTGIELAVKLQQIRPGLPIVLCTGYSELITDEHLEDVGIQGFLMKPVGYRELAGTVRRVLHGEEGLDGQNS